MPTSVRLDLKTEHLIRRLAKEKGQTKSEVIREAISFFFRRETATGKPIQPYDALIHLIRCVDSGHGGLSEKTGERFRSLMRDKLRARRKP
jgi:hypothetical protein